MRNAVMLAVAVLGMTPVVACTFASPTHINVQEEQKKTDGGASPTPTGATPASNGGGINEGCGTDDFVKPDLATLAACGNGKGHCFAKDKAPLSDQLTPCENASEVCVPDEIIEANGKPLKSCTSIVGPGGCVTASLIPIIEQQGGSALKPDVCDADQLCVPCQDPTNNNAPSGFCEPIGVHEKACTAGPAAGGDGGGGAPAAAQGCCTTKGVSNGICISEEAVPEAQREDAPQDTCADKNKCVPRAFVEGKPVKCGGNLLGSGVCMDQCFNGMLGIAGDIGFLEKEGCGDSEVCVPCRFLEGQGVPGCN